MNSPNPATPSSCMRNRSFLMSSLSRRRHYRTWNYIRELEEDEQALAEEYDSSDEEEDDDSVAMEPEIGPIMMTLEGQQVCVNPFLVVEHLQVMDNVLAPMQESGTVDTCTRDFIRRIQAGWGAASVEQRTQIFAAVNIMYREEQARENREEQHRLELEDRIAQPLPVEPDKFADSLSQ